MAVDQSDIGLASLRDYSIHTQISPTNHLPASPQSTNSFPKAHLSHEETTRKSWKYKGYSGYCNFVSHVNDFVITRRFSAVAVRVLLALQDKVVILEERLRQLDDAYSRPDAQDVHNGSYRDDQDDRTALIWEMHTSLQEYYSFAKQYSDVAGRPRPKVADVQSINNWLETYKDAIIDSEQEYLKEKQYDLASLIPKARTPLRKLLENCSRFRGHSFFKRVEPPDLPISELEKECTIRYSNNAMDRITTVIIIALGLVMLLAPAWILEFLNSSIAKLGVISAFVILFTCMVQYAMVVKHGETLAAAAAYAAVLMVFLQLGN